MTTSHTRTVLITGATSGIGKAAATALAGTGWRVLLGARNPYRAQAAVDEIHRLTGSDQLDVVQMELTSLESVRMAAQQALELAPRLDVLINNAGTVTNVRHITDDGLEMIMQTNHFSHFLLTSLLLPRLLESDDARVINVSSGGYRRAVPMPLDDLQLEQHWGRMQPYVISKLANVLFTNELHRRYEAQGLSAFSVSPGAVKTNFGEGPRGIMRLVFAVIRPFFLTPEKGATPLVELATDADKRADAGAFYERHERRELAPNGKDREAASGLWERSVELTGASWQPI